MGLDRFQRGARPRKKKKDKQHVEQLVVVLDETSREEIEEGHLYDFRNTEETQKVKPCYLFFTLHFTSHKPKPFWFPNSSLIICCLSRCTFWWWRSWWWFLSWTWYAGRKWRNPSSYLGPKILLDTATLHASHCVSDSLATISALDRFHLSNKPWLA